MWVLVAVSLPPTNLYSGHVGSMLCQQVTASLYLGNAAAASSEHLKAASFTHVVVCFVLPEGHAQNAAAAWIASCLLPSTAPRPQQTMQSIERSGLVFLSACSFVGCFGASRGWIWHGTISKMVLSCVVHRAASSSTNTHDLVDTLVSYPLPASACLWARRHVLCPAVSAVC